MIRNSVTGTGRLANEGSRIVVYRNGAKLSLVLEEVTKATRL
jgi:hypothetical protein